MRAFLIALGLLFLTAALVIWNAYYVNGIASQMRDMVMELPDFTESGCASAADRICFFWNDHVNTVGLSVGYTVADRVSEQAVSLAATARSGDYYGFCLSRALLLDALSDMSRLERFSIGNLL